MDYDGGAKDIVLRGIAAIVTCIVLIFALVFFTNREQLLERFFGETQQDEASGFVTVESEGSNTEFGLMIGDHLKAFISDETFFNDSNVIPVTEDYVEEEVVSVSILATIEDGDIVISLFDSAGTVLTGERFKVTLSREEAGRDISLVFIDDDEDGEIRAKGLTNGEWTIGVEERDGYHMPVQEAKIMLGPDADASTEASSSDEADENRDGDGNDGNNNDNGGQDDNGNNNDNSGQGDSD